MRLERIEITGFGRISELQLDLAPCMTVLLGANEAGKSTIHRAVRTALYGIDAGGQGRAVERSDWSRWSPWGGGPYGVALTYRLADGRRFRIARRLESRDSAVQVQEIGGREVTDQMRVGRAVVPGRVHLGIDEAVFCATACAGEESLRADSPDGAATRADRLQEAIERLADSASRATAAEAVARLRAAEARIGTEKRASTPLGAATAVLRRCEAALDDAHRRAETLGQEQDRLRRLEESAAKAEAVRVEREREWLVGRLAAIATQGRELESALAEAQRLEGVIGGWSRYAAFPVEREERVIALGGELTQATAADAEATHRWGQARERLRALERRRVEIAASLRALGRVPRVTPDQLEEARALSAELAAEAGAERQTEGVQRAEARAAALRQEIAATGLAGIRVGAADSVAELLRVAARPVERSRLTPVAAILTAVGLLLGLSGIAAGLHIQGAAALAGCVLGAGCLLLADRLSGGPTLKARRELSRRCPGLDLSDAGMSRALQRLPALLALHADLQRQELLVEAGREELEVARVRVAELTQRCLTLAARIPVEVRDAVDGRLGQATVSGLLAQARAALEAVEDASGSRRRCAELEEEDARLVREEASCRVLHEDAERRSQVREALEQELARHLQAGDLPPEADPTRAVAAFRQASSTRRQLEATQERLLEVRRRITVLGADAHTLQRQAVQLGEELRRRGGDPAQDAAAAKPLDAARLQALEHQAAHARQAANAALAEAMGLRERLAGALGALPLIADLEDERAAALAARERALRQLEALRRAREMIEDTARRVHRNVAPRLAGSVASRLALLTDGRYDAVNVDSDGFAVSLRGRERPDLVPLELLSHGTRDQVGLLLRLALAEVLGEAGEPVPLLLDDPLLSSDPARRHTAVEFLLRLGETAQVVLTTADPAVANQVAAAGRDCTVVALPPPRDDRLHLGEEVPPQRAAGSLL